MRPKWLLLSALPFLLVSSALAETYKFTLLNPAVANYTLRWPVAINNKGDVVINGINNSTNAIDAIFILGKHGLTRVQFPGTQPDGAYGTAIADDDRIGGVMVAHGQSDQSFFELNDEGRLTIMPPPPAGVDSAFLGMNNRGDFTMGGGNNSACRNPYYFANGVYVPIQYPGVTIYTAGGISNNDTVVGTLIDLQEAYMLRNGKFTLFTVPGAQATHANCISPSGNYIAGDYFTPVGGELDGHPYVRKGHGEFVDTGSPAPLTINGQYGLENLLHTSVGITGINDKGEICGYANGRYGNSNGAEVIEFGFIGKPKHGP